MLMKSERHGSWGRQVGGAERAVEKLDADRETRYLGVELGEHVALVAGTTRRLPRHEGEYFESCAGCAVRCLEAPAPVLRVDTAVGDLADVVMLAEEELARLVCQRDALPGHLEVDHGGGGQRPPGCVLQRVCATGF